MTLIAFSDTAGFACLRNGDRRCTHTSASSADGSAPYFEMAERIESADHSVAYDNTVISCCTSCVGKMIPSSQPNSVWTSTNDSWFVIEMRAAAAAATTAWLPSMIAFLKAGINSWSKTTSLFTLNNFATHVAAHLRTYGSASPRQRVIGVVKYSAVSGVATEPIVRIAFARMIGESWLFASISKAFTQRRATDALFYAFDVRKI